MGLTEAFTGSFLEADPGAQLLVGVWRGLIREEYILNCLVEVPLAERADRGGTARRLLKLWPEILPVRLSVRAHMLYQDFLNSL